jgi:N-acetylmuramoyl-L-alanine amidase
MPPKIGRAPQAKETWVSLNRWCKSRGLAPPALLAMAPLPSFALKTPGGSLILRVGSRVAWWEGLDLRLGYAPQLVDGQPFVHALDLEKNILPLLGSTPLSCLHSNPVIVIDPGHGGENAGTKSVLGSRYEKEFTLDWARRLQRLLVTNGWQVFLTRSNDSDLALSNRVAFAQARQAGLFLSLHFNSAAPDEGEAGLETYVLTPTGMPSTVTRGFSDDPALTFPNNAFDAQNLQLAVRIHREVLAVNGHQDRGLRRARFPGVLRNQQRPAVLVEGGYLSNPREARLIATPAYREKLAVAVARALVDEGTATQRVEAHSQTNSP